ncbi:MAG: hypothetical protein GY862_37585 [Gammaproteobacteria bacterium]|nr:hypothetical protein [Gammaproteobacteria bacterium]
MGRSRYKFEHPQSPHFMTCTILHWIPVFTRPDTVDILLHSFRYLQTEDDPECIESEIMLRQKVDYIHRNPVERGYVDLPWHWRYSSARNYEEMPGLLEVFQQW